MKKPLVNLLAGITLCSLFVLNQTVQAESAPIEQKSDIDVSALATQYHTSINILKDYISSYNFKCPQPLKHQQLVWLLTEGPYDSELKVMVESEEMSFRDIYVEARASIPCMTKGQVSKAY